MQTITQREVVDLMKEARVLKKAYDRENNKNPGGYFDHGGEENIALRLFEKRYDATVVGADCKNGSVKLHVVEGRIVNPDIHYIGSTTTDFVFDGMKKGEMADFARYICETLAHRGSNGIPKLRMMVGDTRKYHKMAEKIQRWAQ